MKGYLINAFTPYISSKYDSRFIRTGNRILNITYSIVSIVSILALGITDPLKFGHMPTAAVVFLFFGFIGVIIQKLREEDLGLEKEYDEVIHEFVLQQNITLDSEDNKDVDGVRLQIETGKSPKRKPGRRKLEEGETPFLDNDYETYIRGVIETFQDHTLKGVDVSAIAQILRDKKLNKGVSATKPRASVPTVVAWILKNYPSKIEPGLKPITMQTGKPNDDCLDKWEAILTRK